MKRLPDPPPFDSSVWIDRAKAWPEDLRAAARAMAEQYRELCKVDRPYRKGEDPGARRAAYWAYLALRSLVEAVDIPDEQGELDVDGALDRTDDEVAQNTATVDRVLKDAPAWMRRPA